MWSFPLATVLIWVCVLPSVAVDASILCTAGQQVETVVAMFGVEFAMASELVEMFVDNYILAKHDLEDRTQHSAQVKNTVERNSLEQLLGSA